MLKTVTITGADDNINPVELASIAQDYPFVEFGILVSKNNFGNNRYPTIKWLNELAFYKQAYKLKLSIHLCGAYARDMIEGNDIAFTELGEIHTIFERVQINALVINPSTTFTFLPAVLSK